MAGLSIDRQENVLRLAGSLRIDDIVPALPELKARCGGTLPGIVDLQGVADCDSAGVALLLELRRMGVAEVRHVPAGMAAIVRACQLEALLPFAGGVETNPNENP